MLSAESESRQYSLLIYYIIKSPSLFPLLCQSNSGDVAETEGRKYVCVHVFTFYSLLLY